MFVYDGQKHLYLLGSRTLPSVTQIVSSAYGIQHYADDFYLHKGSMLHKAISLLLQGVLDESSVDDRIKGKLEGAKKAVKELSLVPKVIETPMYHKVLMCAGTPDMLTKDYILVDWKSSASPLTSPPQLGGYAEILESNGFKVKTCYEITLSDAGTYKAEPYEIRRCKRLFNAGLTVFNHKQKEGAI